MDSATTSPVIKCKTDTNRDPPRRKGERKPGHDPEKHSIACVGLARRPIERESGQRQEKDGSDGDLPQGGLVWVPVGVALRVPRHTRSVWAPARTHPHMPLTGSQLDRADERPSRDTCSMPREPGRGRPRFFQRILSMPSVTSGRALLLAMLGLLVCDVIGGFVARASGADTWSEAWGFETEHTVPLPVGAAQLVLAWLAARNTLPPVGLTAAVLLSAFCLISLLAGLFDGDLIKNVASAGLVTWGVAWAGVLLAVTAAVGLLAAIRAKQLRELRVGTHP